MGGGYFLVKVTGKNLREMVSQGRTRRDQFPFLVMIQMSGGSVKTGKTSFPGWRVGCPDPHFICPLSSQVEEGRACWEWLNGTGSEKPLCYPKRFAWVPANLTFWSRATVAMIFGHPPLTVGKTGRQREWEHREETECRILDIGGGWDSNLPRCF